MSRWECTYRMAYKYLNLDQDKLLKKMLKKSGKYGIQMIDEIFSFSMVDVKLK